MEHITYRGVYVNNNYLHLFIYLLFYKTQLPCEGNDGEGNYVLKILDLFTVSLS